MSIVYQYYKQGSTFPLAFGTTASVLNDIFSRKAVNHLSVTSTVDCYVQVSETNSAPIAVTNSSQFVMARTETIIPFINARSISVIGTTNGTLYSTEYYSA